MLEDNGEAGAIEDVAMKLQYDPRNAGRSAEGSDVLTAKVGRVRFDTFWSSYHAREASSIRVLCWLLSPSRSV